MSFPRNYQLPWETVHVSAVHCRHTVDHGTYKNAVDCAKVFLDRGPCGADEAEIRLLLKASGEAICADPLQLIARP